MTLLSFTVDGNPLPKQSFVYDGNGRGHTDPRVRAWQDTVSTRAREAMNIRNLSLITGPVKVWLEFYRKDNRKVDGDNLSKLILDACNGIIWKDDRQAWHITIIKHENDGKHGVARPRVEITVQECAE